MADDALRNPFQTLYLTEAVVDPERFASLFSPLIIKGEVERLFKLGNTVLQGSNGTGKTMLLRLFSPDVRAAMMAHQVRLSLPDDLFASLSIGINFVHAGFGVLGHRRVSPDHEANVALWQMMTADLLNYSLVYELLTTLNYLNGDKGTQLRERIDLQLNRATLDAYADWLSRRDCWFGALEGNSQYEPLLGALRERIQSYRAFINWNIKSVPREIMESKTRPGAPISEARKGLAVVGILSADVPFIVTVDQYETLANIDFEPTRTGQSIGRALCQVVNAFLATRDPSVSYKVGVRPYAWKVEPRYLGSNTQLELGRDYQMVDLDVILQRHENTAWAFPKFAEDVAGRRIASLLGGPSQDYQRWLPKRLEHLQPGEELDRYCAREKDRLLPGEPAWGAEWNAFLRELYEADKFEARLAEVWSYQITGRGESLPAIAAARRDRPWSRPWWQKERQEAILMQSASRCRQRRVYSGWDMIMTLTGANILVFLSICREIWDIWARSRDAGDISEKISAEKQSQAIRLVSESWMKKQEEFPGGKDRRDFVIRFGIGARKALLDDYGLAYPGHNGFSLLTEDYEAASDVTAFLDNATDFGALITSPHTTKERDRRPRRKWYLFPILCPQFEIPATRTKEPYYAELSEIREWINTPGLTPVVFRRGQTSKKGPKRRSRGRSPRQDTLFGEEGKK
jgi:hypothetical protein